MMKKIFTTILGFLFAGGMAAQSVKHLPPKEFKSAMDMAGQFVLLDVRTPGEVANGKLAGAKNIDFRNRTFNQEVQLLDVNQPVFIYCHSGGRSSAAANRMAGMGFTQIYNLKGGIVAWNRQEMPIEK